MATKYNTITETVTAIQFLFDNAKEIYIFLGMKDFSMYVKNRILSGTITGSNEEKLQVQKNDYVVKDSNGNISVWTETEFKKHFTEVQTSA